MIKGKTIYDNNFHGYPIITNAEKQQGCYENILGKMKIIFDDMITRHCKVFFIRFDARYPIDSFYPDGNELFIRFMASLNRYLERQDLDPRYLWVREQSKEKKQHYHCFLLLDGNKVQSCHYPLKKAEELWNRALGLPLDTPGLIDHCDVSRSGAWQKNGIMINRGGGPELNDCFRWASYLAKVNTKGKVPNGVREIGGSQIRSR
jgi:hypothetical protein